MFHSEWKSQREPLSLVGVMQREVALLGGLSTLCASDYTPGVGH